MLNIIKLKLAEQKDFQLFLIAFAVTIAVALGLFLTPFSVSIPQAYGATQSTTSPTLTLTVQTSLTFTVTTNNFGNVEPSANKFATTTLDASTNNTSGWSVILYGTDQSPTDTVCEIDGADTDGITDDTEWIPGAATTTAGNATRFNAEEVFAFRVMTASSTNGGVFWSTTWWGTVDDYADNASTLWAGIASSTLYRQIGNAGAGSYSANRHVNTVLYYLRVPNTQKTGAYSCPLVYAATANP